jgi:hypothetical protein
MSRRKGEVTSREIDRRYPHQVAIRADQCAGKNHEAVHGFCGGERLAPRGHCVRCDDVDYVVFCFAEASDADLFRKRFSGERFDPQERGRGAAWHRWIKR